MLKSYPWYIGDWKQSETRITLTLEQRGLYRELIDHCYAEGSIPSDRDMLLKLTASSSREFDRAWPAVRKLFQDIGNGRLCNRKVQDLLPELLHLQSQRAKASQKASQARWEKERARLMKRAGIRDGMRDASVTDSATESVAQCERNAFASAHLQPITSTSTTTTTDAPPLPPSEGHWYPLTAHACREKFPTTDDFFVAKLVQAVAAADPAPELLTDENIALAVRKTHTPKQRGAGMWLTTVPLYVKNHKPEPPEPDRTWKDPYAGMGVF
jgi:uncharacterized protein YdaU (DUF1376 family)